MRVWKFLRHPRVKSSSGSSSRSPHKAKTIESQDVYRVAKDTKPVTARTVLHILNRGGTYGSLYSYDYLFSDDRLSPLHKSNVVQIDRFGTILNVGKAAHGFPSRGSRIEKILIALFLTVITYAQFKTRYPLKIVWLLSKTCASVDVQRRSIKRDFPSLKLAVLAYELQVTGSLVLALESLGVPTVAVNERPNSLKWEMQPFAVSVLLTASSAFSKAAMLSRTVAVGTTIPVGMWRTDLLQRYRSETPHEVYQRAKRNNQRLVVALPNHVTAGESAAGVSVGTSVASVRHFLMDIVSLARSRNDLFFVIRGKDAEWLQDPRFSSVTAQIECMPNIEVSQDYETLNESYRLCAWADTVIAKYTSLAEEALACGIPCVLHDYIPNCRDLVRPVVSHLPRRIWAEDFEELQCKLSFTLASGGNTFAEWWEPYRSDVFGDLADGLVRERARVILESLVDRGPAK